MIIHNYRCVFFRNDDLNAYDHHRKLKKEIFVDELGFDLGIDKETKDLVIIDEADPFSWFLNVYLDQEVISTVRATPILEFHPHENIFPFKYFNSNSIDPDSTWSINALAVKRIHRKKILEVSGENTSLSRFALSKIIELSESKGATALWCTSSSAIIANTLERLGFVSITQDITLGYCSNKLNNYVFIPSNRRACSGQ